MNKFRQIADYLSTVEPSKTYEDYERHKKAIDAIVGNDTNLWIEAIKDLLDRMGL